MVDDAGWDAFLADAVTSRFPDGPTILDAQGQWREPEAEVAKERSKVLPISVAPGDGAARRIDEVSDEYARRLQQEPVLRVVDDACASCS